jgi:hypothetical protein
MSALSHVRTLLRRSPLRKYLIVALAAVLSIAVAAVAVAQS